MTTLTQLFTGIANAIRSKTGGTAQIAAENFPAEIAAISTGTDTSDANATAANIEEGKTAYVNGQKVTGSLMVLGDTYQGTATPKVTNGMVSLGRNLEQKLVVPTTSNIEFLAPYSAFGTATAADVAAGKTFTGADGLKVEGTAAAGGSVTMGQVTVSNVAGNISVTGLNLPAEPKNLSLWFHPSSGIYLSNIDWGDYMPMYTVLNFTVTNSRVYFSTIWKTYNSSYMADLQAFDWGINEFDTSLQGEFIDFSMNQNGFTLSSTNTDRVRFIPKRYYYMIW